MITRRTFLAGCLPAALCACSTTEIVRTVEAAARGGSATGAIRNVLSSKAQSWARNPYGLKRDLKNLEGFLQDFFGDVVKVWGDDHVATPSETVYVKYSDAYQTRAIVDFDKSLVRVETLVASQLKPAIVTTLLSPSNPQSVDLFSDKPVQLGGVPFLYNQVVDHDKKAIRWEWRANRFADYLIQNKRTVREITIKDGVKKTEYAVEFPLVQTHPATRQNNYAPLVHRYASQYNLQRALVYAVIEVESNFNPYAVSWVPAYGLMQIVPKTAGRDAYEVVHGHSGTPSRDYLFQPENNIRMGCAYLDILNTRYLREVKNPVSREYCVIAGYNGGAGNVLRSFNKRRNLAFAQINRMTPDQVYQRLRTKMPVESQRYLVKVLQAKKKFS